MGCSETEPKKRDKGKQVLIGGGSECQRYLLSQRGLGCEARLSRGPWKCEVIMGKRGSKQIFRWRDTRERERGRQRVNVEIKLAME